MLREQSCPVCAGFLRLGRRPLSCAALLLATWHGGAGAMQDGRQIQDFTNLPLENLLQIEVRSASKFQQSIREAPSAVSVITSHDIKTFGWRTLGEILNSLPGMHLTNDRAYTYLGARGFLRSGDYNPRFLLMIDGARINDPLYDQAMMGQEMLLDVDLIDRVEYVPGPGSSIYGSNAVFGVINLITKRGRDINGAQVSAEGGSAGMGKGRATLGGKSENGVEWLLSATKYNRDGKDLTFPEFPGTVVRRMDFERAQSVFGKASAGPFNLTFGYNERTKGNPTGSYDQALNDSRSRMLDANGFLNVDYVRRMSEHTELTARVNVNRYEYRGDYVASSDSSMSYDRSKANWWGGEFKLLTTALASHKLVAGIEYQRNATIGMRNFITFPSYTESFNVNTSNYRLGLYAQDEWTVHPDWLLSMGLRYDRNSALQDGDQINPRVGVIYKISPSTTAKILYGKAYRVPNAYELYYNDMATDATQKSSVNLRPERIQSAELVLEHQWAPNSRVRLSAYQNKVRDMVALTTDSGDGLLVFRNVGQAIARGVEAEWQHAWGSGARLRASAGWQHAKDEETGQTLANAPRLLGKLNLSLPFYREIWRAGLELQHASGSRTLDLPDDGRPSRKLGSYTLANLTLFSDRLYKGVEVSASIYNLFDRRYAVPVGAEFVQDALTQDGRSFRVKLTYGF